MRPYENQPLRARKAGVAISNMDMKRILLTLIAILIAGCAAADVAGQGVSGSVLLGPHCPVVQEGEDAPIRHFKRTWLLRVRMG